MRLTVPRGISLRCRTEIPWETQKKKKDKDLIKYPGMISLSYFIETFLSHLSVIYLISTFHIILINSSGT